jgi:hypothetical protein
MVLSEIALPILSEITNAAFLQSGFELIRNIKASSNFHFKRLSMAGDTRNFGFGIS